MPEENPLEKMMMLIMKGRKQKRELTPVRERLQASIDECVKRIAFMQGKLGVLQQCMELLEKNPVISDFQHAAEISQLDYDPEDADTDTD